MMTIWTTAPVIATNVMEALAAGAPVVARDLPVLRDVFADTVVYGKDVVSLAAGVLNQV